MKFGSLIKGAFLYVTDETGELWPTELLGPQKVKSVKNVTLFSYTVWPTAIKFGTVTGIDA